MAPGLSCGFSFTSVRCVSASEVARTHEPVRQEETKVVNGACRLPRHKGTVVGIGM